MGQLDCKVSALVVAAGSGKRMGAEVPKQYLPIYGKPLVVHTLERIALCKSIDEIVVVVPEGDERKMEEYIEKWRVDKIEHIVAGGPRRQDSVFRGLKKVSENVEIVIVHDGVRPLISVSKICELIVAVREYGAAVLAVPLNDTIKICRNNWIEKTLDRKDVWRVQTPQGFKKELIVRGYEKAFEEKIDVTDDASLIERLNHPVRILRGEDTNIKITTSEDLRLAELIISRKEQ